MKIYKLKELFQSESIRISRAPLRKDMKCELVTNDEKSLKNLFPYQASEDVIKYGIAKYGNDFIINIDATFNSPLFNYIKHFIISENRNKKLETILIK